MQQLYDVYEHNNHRIGIFEERRNQRMTLLPTAHMLQSAQIQINLNPDGTFLNAKVIENERTIVPMSLDSANRSGSAIRPHYLHDKLFYVAGDYIQYGGNEKRADYFKAYYKQMQEWACHPSATKEVKAIFTYISKGAVIQDLINEKIFPTDENGKVILKMSGKNRPEIYRLVSGEVLDAFVRFDVVEPNSVPVWENRKIFDSFIVYFDEVVQAERGLCYVSGKKDEILTTQHGSRIRNAGDLSKLISANDNIGFTYRGRFNKPTEAVQIGYEVSQKSHQALRWLIQRQGTYIDSRYFVAFGIEHPEIPEPFSEGLAFLSEDIKEKAEEKVLTEEIISEEIIKSMNGFKHKFEEEQLKNIIVMAVDAATSGRLAIVYYQQFNPNAYIESLTKWHNTCRWLQVTRDKETKKIRRFVGTPSTYRIAEAVYGSKADARIKKDFYTRLLPCILEEKKLPNDIVRIIFNRVKNPYSFRNTNESWEGTLNIACALINKQYESEGYTLALQEDNNSRDYLFGRLLGIAEVMERRMLKERDESRATNATRYFNAFSQHPARTWHVIRKQINPYFERLGARGTNYAKLLQEMESRITVEQMTDDPLGPVFLLGYSSQIQDMYTKKEENSNDSVTE